MIQSSHSGSNLPDGLRLPLWTTLIIPSSIIIIILISLTTYLSHRNTQVVVDEMANQIIGETNERINLHLEAFFDIPTIINESNANALTNQMLDIDDEVAIGKYLWGMVQLYDTITSIYIGNPEGGLVSGGREGADGSLYIMTTDNFERGTLTKYSTTENGDPADILFTLPDFDARVRPWYIGAVEKSDANWTTPYVLSTGQDLAVAASRPVYDNNGDLLAVVSVDLFLSHINNFLQNLNIGKTGQVYIVDDSGLLVATSTDNPAIFQDESDTWQRLLAVESDNPIIATSAQHIFDATGTKFDISHSHDHSLNINGEEHYLLVSPFSHVGDLNWYIIITLPTSDFLAPIHAQDHVTYCLTLFAVILAMIIGAITAYKVSYPITQLNKFAENVARGNWSQKVPVRGVRETRVLGHAFNRMSAQLHDLFGLLEDRIRERTRELATSEERYRAIIEDQTELICRYTSDFSLTFVNSAYCRYIGKSESELIGKSFMPYVAPEDRASLQQELRKVSTENPVVKVTHRNVNAEGEMRWMQWFNRGLFDASHQLLEFQAVGRDVTEIKKIEETLKLALEHETELNQLKSHFITTVSHEFRTPLSIILNSSQMLERYNDRLDDEKRNYQFIKINEQMNHLTNMLDDVVAFSRANNGKLEFTPKLFDIVALSETIISEIKVSSKRKETTLQHNGHRNIVADEKLFRLIMTNLVSNAVKYSPPDSPITIRLDCTDTNIELSVQDKGIGIPKEAQGHIFEHFYRADNTAQVQGTGLGLAIVKQAVMYHGGTLSFESEVNQGTTFIVNLPNQTDED